MQQQNTPQASARMLKDAYFQSTAWLYAYTEAKGIRSLKTHIIYCVIYSHSMSSGAAGAAYYGTLETLQFWTRSSDRGTVIKGLKELESAGMIRKVTYQHNGHTRNAYIANVAEATAFRDALDGDGGQGTMSFRIADSPTLKNPTLKNPTLKNPTPSVEKSHTAVLKNPTLNNSSEKNSLNNKEETRDARAREDAQPVNDDIDAGHRLAEAAMQPTAQISGLGAPTARPLPRSAVDVGKYMQSLPNCPPSPLRDDIATAFFDGFEATGWISTKGLPILDWQAMARIYLTRWVNNERDKLAQQYMQRQQQQPRQYSKPAPAPKPTPKPEAPATLTEEGKAEIRSYTDEMVEERGLEKGLQDCWSMDLGKPKTPKIDQQYWLAYIAEKYGVTNFTPKTETQQ